MYKRILTVQDVSCVGQCSLTVALPILSAFGIETAILPTAVLSNHTMFSGWTFADLTCEMPKINERWGEENLDFCAIYTGYLGSAEQISHIKDIAKKRLISGGELIVDPVMADNGKLYPAFDLAFVEEMKKLVSVADIVMPNITEACFLTGNSYREDQSPDYIESLIDGLRKKGAKKVIITGVSFSPDKLGVAVNENGCTEYRFEQYLDKKYHGTGDIFASALTGAYMCGDSLADSAQFGAQVVIEAIRNTMGTEHWYGVRFEKALPFITNKYNK